jgi:methionyl-tRNA formyltransferase
LGLPVISNETRNDGEIAELIRTLRPDALVAVQHPWIIPRETLDLVRGAAFNLHSAKLPDYRGHNAANHAILDRAPTSTVTLQWMAPEADMGPVAFEETFETVADDTARSLYERGLSAGEFAFGRFLDALAAGPDSVPRRALVGTGRFFPRSSIDDEREIRDPSDPDEVDVRSRALFFPPFEPAFFVADGRKHYVLPPGFVRFASEFGGVRW